MYDYLSGLLYARLILEDSIEPEPSRTWPSSDMPDCNLRDEPVRFKLVSRLLLACGCWLLERGWQIEWQRGTLDRRLLRRGGLQVERVSGD